MTAFGVPIGSLRHSIVIEKPTKVSDGQGGFTRTDWTTYLAAFAEIRPASSSEKLFAFQKAMEVSHKLTIRYRWDKAPTIEMRVNFTIGTLTRIFMIKGIMNIEERNRYLTLLCTEGVGA